MAWDWLSIWGCWVNAPGVVVVSPEAGQYPLITNAEMSCGSPAEKLEMYSHSNVSFWCERFVWGGGGVSGWELSRQSESYAAESQHHHTSLLASYNDRRHGRHAGHVEGSCIVEALRVYFIESFTVASCPEIPYIPEILKLFWNQKLSWNFSHLVRMSWYWHNLCYALVTALPSFCTWLPHNWTLYIADVECPVLFSIVTVHCFMCNIFMTAVLICLTD